MANNIDELVLGVSPLQPHETPLAHARPSKRLLVGEAFQAVSVVAITLLVSLVFHRIGLGDPAEYGAVAPFAFGFSAVTLELFYLVPRLIRAFVHVAFTQYMLTNDRVYARTEFFSTDLKVVPYEKITQVSLHRGLFGWLMGISELRLRAYGAQEGTIRMRGLTDPWPSYAAVRDQIRVHNTAEAVVRSD